MVSDPLPRQRPSLIEPALANQRRHEVRDPAVVLQAVPHILLPERHGRLKVAIPHDRPADTCGHEHADEGDPSDTAAAQSALTANPVGRHRYGRHETADQNRRG